MRRLAVTAQRRQVAAPDLRGRDTDQGRLHTRVIGPLQDGSNGPEAESAPGHTGPPVRPETSDPYVRPPLCDLHGAPSITGLKVLSTTYHPWTEHREWIPIKSSTANPLATLLTGVAATRQRDPAGHRQVQARGQAPRRPPGARRVHPQQGRRSAGADHRAAAGGRRGAARDRAGRRGGDRQGRDHGGDRDARLRTRRGVHRALLGPGVDRLGGPRVGRGSRRRGHGGRHRGAGPHRDHDHRDDHAGHHDHAGRHHHDDDGDDHAGDGHAVGERRRPPRRRRRARASTATPTTPTPATTTTPDRTRSPPPPYCRAAGYALAAGASLLNHLFGR